MPPNARISVLVADDSSLMRLLLTRLVEQQADMEVIGTAANGQEAFQQVLALKPDVLLLDLVMTPFDGVYAVEEVMKHHPLPILILSAAGQSNPDLVLAALNKGAYDFINKPTTNASQDPAYQALLITRIREASQAQGHLGKKKLSPNQHPHIFDQLLYDAIVIGASTGGTGVIEGFIQQLPANLPVPVFIAQHMPEEFLRSFAKRLSEQTPLQVRIPEEYEPVRPGILYIMPGGRNTKIDRQTNNHRQLSFLTTREKFPAYNFPSVDCLMYAVARHYESRTIGVLLSGMGQDGAQGMKAIYDAGGFTIAQDKHSCVVFGMPKAAIELGVVRQVLPADQMAAFVISCLG